MKAHLSQCFLLSQESVKIQTYFSVSCSRLTHIQYNTICAKIITLFPNELSTIYYVSRQKDGYALQAKGKLVYKAHNILNNSPDRIYVRKRKLDRNEELAKKPRNNSEGMYAHSLF